MTKTDKIDLAEKLIEAFSKEFYRFLGIYPVITYCIEEEAFIKIGLPELETITNNAFKRNYPQDYLPGGIRNRSRKRVTVLFRQVYMKIATDMGHYLTSTGRHIGYDHTSVLYGNNTITNLLEIEDSQVTQIYNLVYYATKE